MFFFSEHSVYLD